jgi:hypothetical protein
LSWLRLILMVGEALDIGRGDSDRAARLIRVNRVTLTARRSLPVFSDQRTFSASFGMSQTCQQATLTGIRLDCGSSAVVEAKRPHPNGGREEHK